MKAIKINDNSVDDDFKDTELVRKKDVLVLIDEMRKSGSDGLRSIFYIDAEELKARILGNGK